MEDRVGKRRGKERKREAESGSPDLFYDPVRRPKGMVGERGRCDEEYHDSGALRSGGSRQGGNDSGKSSIRHYALSEYAVSCPPSSTSIQMRVVRILFLKIYRI